MESASRSSEEEDDFGRAQGSPHPELAVRVDGRNGEQMLGTPTTPRSKHSATEQRRRCKINERFQKLRDLIPHSDQKRDRATFLLEVIEYVNFLQEKVQKYEAYPEWNQESTKLAPWGNHRVTADGADDLSHAARNGPAPEFTFAGKFVDNSIGIAPSVPSNAQNVAESDMNTTTVLAPTTVQPNLYSSCGRDSSFVKPQQGAVSDSDNMAAQSQSQWKRLSCPADCTVSDDIATIPEGLTIDEGTITVSTLYSHNLFATLTRAMESSGVDLSQASVTVQVNLGKKAACRSPAAMSNAKDLDGVAHANRTIYSSGAPSGGDDPQQASKRQKADD